MPKVLLVNNAFENITIYLTYSCKYCFIFRYGEYRLFYKVLLNVTFYNLVLR